MEKAFKVANLRSTVLNICLILIKMLNNNHLALERAV
jgi:hypothetical protein